MCSWGNGSDGALGHGDFESRASPQLVSDVDLSRPKQDLDSDSEDEQVAEPKENPDRFVQVISVACGGEVAGSHTVIVTNEGLALCACICGAGEHMR